MPKRSFDSVKIIWLDREKVLQALTTAVRKLRTAHPEIRRVWVFGSLARGEAVPGSDADLLIEVSDTGLRFLDRFVAYQPTNVSIGVDVFVYTTAELTRMQRDGNPFIRRALAEGRPLLS